MQARSQIDRPDETLPRESFGQLLSQLATHSAALVRDEVALARQEMRESARSLRMGIVTLAIGALIGWIALATLAAAAVIGLANLMNPEYAALIVGGALAVFGGGVAMVGINRLKRTNLTPEQTVQTLEEDKQWLKELT
ncbi:MAG TPA: phage holin family protein [Blastocatellia bacterium]|nr:phage holin family protein [Blastocatellia bacterium]